MADRLYVTADPFSLNRAKPGRGFFIISAALHFVKSCRKGTRPGIPPRPRSFLVQHPAPVQRSHDPAVVLREIEHVVLQAVGVGVALAPEGPALHEPADGGPVALRYVLQRSVLGHILVLLFMLLGGVIHPGQLAVLGPPAAPGGAGDQLGGDVGQCGPLHPALPLGCGLHHHAAAHIHPDVAIHPDGLAGDDGGEIGGYVPAAVDHLFCIIVGHTVAGVPRPAVGAAHVAVPAP